MLKEIVNQLERFVQDGTLPAEFEKSIRNLRQRGTAMETKSISDTVASEGTVAVLHAELSAWRAEFGEMWWHVNQVIVRLDEHARTQPAQQRSTGIDRVDRRDASSE